MTKAEMKECLNMAKRFAELYNTTGLIAFSTGMDKEPRIHLTNEAFMQMYENGEFHFNTHGYSDVEMYTEDEGVTVFTLMDMKGEADE